MDLITANQTAVSGVTLVEFVNPSVRIRDGLTTNMTNVLTRLPTVTQISDFVEIQSRATTDAFIGTKFLSSRANDVVVSMTALFKGLIQAEIIAAFTGLTASTDPNDPTMLDFGAYYQPIFPLQYISVTLNLRSSLSS